MTYRTILVHLDTSRQARRRLDVAVRLATAHGARGLYSAFVAEPHSFYGGADDLLERQQREASRDELAREFANAASRAGLRAEWRAPKGAPNTVVPLHARHADLIVASQPDPDDLDASVAPHFVENLLLSAGRPVLLVPYAGTLDSVGARPMIAWDCSRAAARAWHDALPLLKCAAQPTDCAGAYGHARVMERVLGGVTRTLLRSMTVPVLMSH